MSRLSSAEVDAVRALADQVAEHDGVAALSERSTLALEQQQSSDAPEPGPETHHVLLPDAAGYAQVWGEGGSELLIAPGRRRCGLGSALWALVRDLGEDSVWAHGDLAAARGFAEAHDLWRSRELHRMERRDLRGIERPRLPEPLSVRAFDPDRDADAWLEVNAAAFADHPEQGRLDRRDLAQRMSQPWFDPAGLLLVVTPDDEIVAFHWTKIDRPSGGSPPSGPLTGEVYVVGVHPAYQGRGLAAPVTALGLAQLRDAGVERIELYVDGDNDRAVRTYAAAGFHVASTDVVYRSR